MDTHDAIGRIPDAQRRTSGAAAILSLSCGFALILAEQFGATLNHVSLVAVSERDPSRGFIIHLIPRGNA